MNMKELYSNVKNALEQESEDLEPDPNTSQTEYNVEKIISQENAPNKREIIYRFFVDSAIYTINDL